MFGTAETIIVRDSLSFHLVSSVHVAGDKPSRNPQSLCPALLFGRLLCGAPRIPTGAVHTLPPKNHQVIKSSFIPCLDRKLRKKLKQMDAHLMSRVMQNDPNVVKLDLSCMHTAERDAGNGPLMMRRTDIEGRAAPDR